jgi:hypothetical protein
MSRPTVLGGGFVFLEYVYSGQADRGFTTSQLRSDEDGISTNRII